MEGKLLTTSEVRKLLRGASKQLLAKLRRYVKAPLPHVRIGKRYLYPEDDVRAWIDVHAKLDPGRPLRAPYESEKSRSGAVVTGKRQTRRRAKTAKS